MRVQISHHPDDREFVDRLDPYLRRMGVEPRRDYLKSPEAEKSAEKLDQELRRYDHIIVVLSRAYTADQWLMNELLQCLFRERMKGGDFILPLQIEECEVPVWLRERVIDFRDAPFEQAVDALAPTLAGPRQVFVAMKFGDPGLDAVYELTIKRAVETCGFSALRIDEVQSSGSITEQTLQQIDRSAVVLADLTGERPNCYFEVGYAHALGKELVLTIRKGEAKHFNLADRRFIEWETDRELYEGLCRRLEAIWANLPGNELRPAA